MTFRIPGYGRGYGGPWPPDAAHRYVFTLYALKVDALEIDDAADYVEFVRAVLPVDHHHGDAGRRLRAGQDAAAERGLMEMAQMRPNAASRRRRPKRVRAPHCVMLANRLQ